MLKEIQDTSKKNVVTAKKSLPPRKIVDLTNNDNEEIEDLLADILYSKIEDV